MGGCASKPKGSDDMLPKPLPVDAPISPKEVEVDAKPPAEEDNKAQPEPEPASAVVDEKINDTPLVDLSEPKQEDVKAEPKALVSVIETEKEPKATVSKAAGPVETKVEPEPVSKVENKNEDPAPLVTL